MGLKTFTIDFAEMASRHCLYASYKFQFFTIEIKKSKQLLKCRVSDYFDTFTGYAFKSEDYEDEGTKLLRIGDFNNYGDVTIQDMVCLPEDYYEKYRKYEVKKDDIVIALTGATIGKTAFIEEFDENILLNQRVGIMRLKNGNINPKLLYLLTKLNFFQFQIQLDSMGKGQQNISPTDVSKIKIPLIPKTKQDHIVTQIEPIEKKIKELRAQITPSQEAINQVFARAFEFDLKKVNSIEKIKYFSITNDLTFRNVNLRSSVRWNKIEPIQKVLYEKNKYVEKLGKYIISTKNGWSPNCKESDSEHCVFGLNSISKDGYIKFEDLKYSNEGKKNIEEYYAQEKDLFVSRGNTVDLVALASVVTNLPEEQNFIFPDLFIRIELNTEYLDKNYLAYLFNSIIGRYYFKYAAKGKNQTMVKISSDELNNFYLPIPPLKLQQKIVNEIKAELVKQENVKNKIETERNKIEKIFKIK